MMIAEPWMILSVLSALWMIYHFVQGWREPARTPADWQLTSLRRDVVTKSQSGWYKIQPQHMLLDMNGGATWWQLDWKLEVEDQERYKKLHQGNPFVGEVLQEWDVDAIAAGQDGTPKRIKYEGADEWWTVKASQNRLKRDLEERGLS